MRCYSCSKYLGFYVFGKWVTRDKHRFCEPCAGEWVEQRRQRVLAEICAGQPPPRPIFTIPKVRTKDPDRPKSREWLLGLTAFTDKGICFIQTASHTGVDEGWGLAFGMIAGIVATTIVARRRREEFAEGEQDVIDPADTFVDLLCRSEQLLFYPRDDITELSFNSTGFTVRLGKYRKRFGMEGGRKTLRAIREVAEAYRSALEQDTDPYQACKQLATEAD